MTMTPFGQLVVTQTLSSTLINYNIKFPLFGSRTYTGHPTVSILPFVVNNAVKILNYIPNVTCIVSSCICSINEALDAIDLAVGGTSDSCEQSLFDLFNATNSSIARKSQMQMFDAWGKLPSGVFQNPLSVIMFGKS